MVRIESWKISNGPRWYASDECPGRNVLGDYRPCCHDTAFAEAYTLEHHRASANPHLVFDMNRASRNMRPVLATTYPVCNVAAAVGEVRRVRVVMIRRAPKAMRTSSPTTISTAASSKLPPPRCVRSPISTRAPAASNTIAPAMSLPSPITSRQSMRSRTTRDAPVRRVLGPTAKRPSRLRRQTRRRYVTCSCRLIFIMLIINQTSGSEPRIRRQSDRVAQDARDECRVGA